MAKVPCLISTHSKYVLLKDFGDTSSYAVLHICKNDTFIKTDKRIKSEDDFIKLYGYGCIHSKEELNKALIRE